jgi:hypothetical protein
LINKAIYNIFLRHNHFNPDKEVLEEISILLNGSKVQDPHGDFQRVYVQMKDENGHLNVVHEIGREQYNRAMDSPFAYSTIMFGLSNLPFCISVPSSYFVETNDPNYVTIRYAGPHRYKVQSHTMIDSFDGKHNFKMIMIEINSGL